MSEQHTTGLSIRGWVDVEVGDRQYHIDNSVSDNMASAAASALSQQSAGVPAVIRIGTGALAGTDLAESDGYAVADNLLAQFWTQNAAGPVVIDHILLGLKRIGTSAATLAIYIYDALGTSVLAQSDSISFNGVSSVTFDWRTFSFSTAVALPPGNYRLVLVPTGYTYDLGVTELQWGTISSNPYAGGYIAKYNAPNWDHYDADPDLDGVFRVVTQTHDQTTAIRGSIDSTQIDGYSKNGRYVARFLSVFGVRAENIVVGHLSLEDTEGTLLAVATVNIEKDATEILRVYWSTEVVPSE